MKKLVLWAAYGWFALLLVCMLCYVFTGIWLLHTPQPEDGPAMGAALFLLTAAAFFSIAWIVEDVH